MLALILLFLAVLLWALAWRLRRAAGLPGWKVVYADTGGWGRLEQALYSPRLGLTGKPDYVVRRGGDVVPVEVKSGRAPADGPYPAHVFQLAAYCLLVAEAYGRRPAYGLIKYADKTLAVDFTRSLEGELLSTLQAMRADGQAVDVARSHASPALCRGCGFRGVCGESLA